MDGNKDSTLKLIEAKSIIKAKSEKGRSRQMNKGVSLSSGTILLFLHADTILPTKALEEIRNILKNKNIKAGAFDLSFKSNKTSLNIIAKIASWRSRITKIPYGDQAIFIRKNIFEDIGKYEDIPIMEDVNIMQKLKKNNYKINISNKKVITSSRKWDNKGVIYTTLRNWILISLYYLKVDPKKLVKFYN